MQCYFIATCIATCICSTRYKTMGLWWFNANAYGKWNSIVWEGADMPCWPGVVTPSRQNVHHVTAYYKTKDILSQCRTQVKHSECFSEVLHHAIKCKEISADYIGREDLLNTIKLRMMNEERTRPIIVTGQPGSGNYNTCITHFSGHLIQLQINW